MSNLSEIKLRSFERKYGSMSSSDALSLAIEAEQYIKDLGPYDIATPTFHKQLIDFVNYALLLEDSGK